MDYTDTKFTLDDGTEQIVIEAVILSRFIKKFQDYN